MSVATIKPKHKLPIALQKAYCTRSTEEGIRYEIWCRKEGCYNGVARFHSFIKKRCHPAKPILCYECRYQKNKLYTLYPVEDSYNPCGGVSIDRIQPLDPTKKLRCHHVYRIERLRVYLDFEDIHSINDWKEVWVACYGWEEGIKTEKYKGKLSRGILSGDGNGLHAVVEDKDGTMYNIHGSWG